MGTGESDRASGAGQAPFVFCRLPSPSGVPACRVLNTAPVCIRGGTALSRAVCWFCSIRVASAVAAAGMAAMFVTQNTDFIASIELRIFFALGCAGIVESAESDNTVGPKDSGERLCAQTQTRFREGAIDSPHHCQSLLPSLATAPSRSISGIKHQLEPRPLAHWRRGGGAA